MSGSASTRDSPRLRRAARCLWSVVCSLKATQTGAPQANVDPVNSQSKLSERRPRPAPLQDAPGATFLETLSVAPANGFSAADPFTPWRSGATKDPEVSSDRERLVIMAEESPAAKDTYLSSLGAPTTSVASMTAGNKDPTNSSDPSDPWGIMDPSDTSDNSGPTNTCRGHAQDVKRVISSGGSRSPRSRDNSGRRPKKPRPGSRDISFSLAEDI
ncbi:hypothetical protein HPB47_019370 [Ixodes persulcatus]|uniref:Uncharacterized protein n=1 Tax=Ixodes persulcatus TaxID=34615 RepID=A0AC60QJ69_IXOPE|nr:hypothetical protein HPB47_019370 [Ixodes persulcatus]